MSKLFGIDNVNLFDKNNLLKLGKLEKFITPMMMTMYDLLKINTDFSLSIFKDNINLFIKFICKSEELKYHQKQLIHIQSPMNIKYNLIKTI